MNTRISLERQSKYDKSNRSFSVSCFVVENHASGPQELVTESSMVSW